MRYIQIYEIMPKQNINQSVRRKLLLNQASSIMRAGQLHLAGDCEICEARVRGGVVLVHLLCLGCGTIPLRVRENMILRRFHFASDSFTQPSVL